MPSSQYVGRMRLALQSAPSTALPVIMFMIQATNFLGGVLEETTPRTLSDRSYYVNGEIWATFEAYPIRFRCILVLRIHDLSCRDLANKLRGFFRVSMAQFVVVCRFATGFESTVLSLAPETRARTPQAIQRRIKCFLYLAKRRRPRSMFVYWLHLLWAWH